jgi:O-antigen/teichoic acid export membrane protein
MRVLQFHRRAFLFSLISVCQLAGILGLSIVLVSQYKWGLMGIILAKSMVNGILFIPILLFMIIKYLSSFSSSIFKQMARYGYPLMPMTLALTFLNFSDRYFLNLFVPQNEIGIYSIAYRIGMIIQMFLVLPLYMSFLPMVFKIGVDSKSNKEIISDMMFYYSVLGCFLFLAVTLFSENLILLIATDVYITGLKFIPIILLAYFINGFRQFFMAVPALKDKTSQLGMIALAVIGINIVSNWFFISTFGTIGAAISTILSFVLLTWAVYLLSQLEQKIHWKWSRILICCFLAGAIFLLAHMLKLNCELNVYLINIAGLILFPIVLRIFNVIGPKELKGVKHLFTSIQTK